jgi:hypothetical protein
MSRPPTSWTRGGQTHSFDEISRGGLAKYIQNTQLQYALVNREQLHVVAEMLAQLNEPNARLGKNWLSRFLNPDLGPFTHLKSYYSKNLKSFIALGDTQVTRARFNVLYHRVREESLTAQYILAG